MWDLREDGFYVPSPLQEDPDDKNQYIWLCDAFEVTEKVVDLLGGDETYTVNIKKPYGNKTFVLDRGETTRRKIFNKFVKKGLSIIDGDVSAGLLKEILLDLENEAPVVFTHKELGFCSMPNGAPVFLGYRPIGNGLSKAQASSLNENAKLLKPKGSYNKWRRFIIDECSRSPPLALALCLGVTAPVAHILKENGVFNDIPLWALVSQSSTGKSTTLKLISSLMLNPTEGIHNFNATSSAFHALLKEHNGAFPFLCDEGSYTPHIDWDEMLYSLPAGSEKRRCKGDGTLREKVSFSGALIITSEKSILERSQMTDGQLARIIEFSLPWFGENKDKAEKAERVSEFCHNNYGWATEPIIKLLLDYSVKKRLIKKYRAEYEDFLKRFDTEIDGVKRRLAQRMALIMASGWVLQKAIRVDFHLKDEKQILIQILADYINGTTDMRNPAEKLYKAVLGEIASQQSKYPNDSHLKPLQINYGYSDIHGCRGIYKNSKCVWIVENRFHRILKDVSEVGFRTSCKLLEDAGYLMRPAPDRYIFEDIPLGAVTADCYCLLLNNVPSVVSTIRNMPESKRDIINVSRTFNDDPLGCYDADIAGDVDKLSSVYKMMKLEFTKLSTTYITVSLNNEMSEKLKLNSTDKLFLMPVPSKGVLIVSKDELIKGSLKLSFHKTSNGVWSENSDNEKLLSLMKIKLKKNERIIFTDIEIDTQNEPPVAVVDYRNLYGNHFESILERKDNYNSVCSYNTSTRSYLLDSSEDD